MAFGCSSVLPCRSRAGRPRPVSFLGIVALLTCRGCLRPFFSQPSDDGGAGGGGGGRGAGSDDAEQDAEAQPVPTKAANNHVGAKQVHSNDDKNDDIQQLMFDLKPIRESLASIERQLQTLANYIIALQENCMANSQGPSTAPMVTGTTENKDAVKRMKGLLGSICSIAEKLPMFCGPVFLWLLSNSSAKNSPAPNSPTSNSPAPKAGQNFEDPWMQVIIAGSLILCFISFILMFFTSKFKESESIDGVLFKISIWLLLPVFLTLWPGLCMILHFFAHTSKFILWPLGTLFSILSVSFWYWGIYKEQQKILELKKACVPENGVSPENPVSVVASAQGFDRDNSYTVQISGPSITSAYALSK